MTERATIEHEAYGEYYVDMGCSLWNRYYKSYSWASKYLKKCGYEKIKTVITL